MAKWRPKWQASSSAWHGGRRRRKVMAKKKWRRVAGGERNEMASKMAAIEEINEKRKKIMKSNENV
jgi:hypothetical protein